MTSPAIDSPNTLVSSVQMGEDDAPNKTQTRALETARANTSLSINGSATPTTGKMIVKCSFQDFKASSAPSPDGRTDRPCLRPRQRREDSPPPSTFSSSAATRTVSFIPELPNLFQLHQHKDHGEIVDCFGSVEKGNPLLAVRKEGIEENFALHQIASPLLPVEEKRPGASCATTAASAPLQFPLQDDTCKVHELALRPPEDEEEDGDGDERCANILPTLSPPLPPPATPTRTPFADISQAEHRAPSGAKSEEATTKSEPQGVGGGGSSSGMARRRQPRQQQPHQRPAFIQSPSNLKKKIRFLDVKPPLAGSPTKFVSKIREGVSATNRQHCRPPQHYDARWSTNCSCDDLKHNKRKFPKLPTIWE